MTHETPLPVRSGTIFRCLWLPESLDWGARNDDHMFMERPISVCSYGGCSRRHRCQQSLHEKMLSKEPARASRSSLATSSVVWMNDSPSDSSSLIGWTSIMPRLSNTPVAFPKELNISSRSTFSIHAVAVTLGCKVARYSSTRGSGARTGSKPVSKGSRDMLPVAPFASARAGAISLTGAVVGVALCRFSVVESRLFCRAGPPNRTLEEARLASKIFPSSAVCCCDALVREPWSIPIA
eukprot:scaffold1386_cov380-Prasinococcus_capsulatus_cf.AAC.3